MIKIKSYNSFFNESKEELNSKQKEFLDTVCEGNSKWEQDDNGFINVEGDFKADGMDLVDLYGIKFGTINGNFNISDNDLENLDGCPKEVQGYFSCSSNYLNSLKGGPTSVKGDYICTNNNLFNLDFIAKDFNGLYASGNDLEYLGDLPQSINGDFFINYNVLLKSLKGSPKIVGGDYDCSDCKLQSLEGGPKKVGGSFNCENNQLNSLAGGPESIGGEFILSYNNVDSLEGIATGANIIDIVKNPISSLQGIDYKSVNKIYYSQNLLPREMLNFQLEYLKERGNLNGWLKEYIEKEPRRFTHLFNMQDSDSNRKKLDSLNLIDFSFEHPRVLLQIVPYIGQNSLLYHYLKNNVDKFSKEFQEGSGLYSDLKDLGF
jgi:hypothetical protein